MIQARLHRLTVAEANIKKSTDQLNATLKFYAATNVKTNGERNDELAEPLASRLTFDCVWLRTLAFRIGFPLDARTTPLSLQADSNEIY